MKKKDLFANIVIGLLAVAIVVVALFKFVFTEPPKASQAFSFKSFETTTVEDMNGDSIKLPLIFKSGEITYCLLFSINDCSTCIIKGTNDLKALRKAGKNCTWIAIHDSVEDVNGWSSVNNISPIFMLKRVNFYENVTASMTPVLIKMNGNKVESYRFITP